MKIENSTEGTVMDLVLEVRTGRERVTMACHGKLVGGNEADTFRRSAMLLLDGFDKLTINLAEVRTVDSGGLSSLASVLGFATDKGKEVRITHAIPMITEMLHVANLERFLVLDILPGPQLVKGAHEAVA
jgi:ABC-type transporter Mla MlaB component